MDFDIFQDRNNFIVEDVGVQVVIVDRNIVGWFLGCEVIIDQFIVELVWVDDINLDCGYEFDDLVYVIYIFGLIGKLKGVFYIYFLVIFGFVVFLILFDFC